MVTEQHMPPTVTMEYAPCEVCGNNAPEPIARRTDLFLGGRVEYVINRCSICRVLYQHPRPTAASVASLYPETYPQYTPGIHTESWLRQLDRRYGLRKRCNAVLRHVKRGGHLLDVGCATGDFLSEMRRRRGWAVVGIELSKFATHYTHSQVGADAVQGILNTAPFADETFDAITMWDVFEHTYDPRTVIAEAARLLRPGGILVISHPNLDSIDRRLFGRFWIGYELPRHIYLFPTNVLRNLAREVGLHEVERRCFYGSYAAAATSMSFVIEHWLGSSRLRQQLRVILFSKTLRLALAPYFLLIDRLRLGSNVTAIFKKH